MVYGTDHLGITRVQRDHLSIVRQLVVSVRQQTVELPAM